MIAKENDMITYWIFFSLSRLNNHFNFEIKIIWLFASKSLLQRRLLYKRKKYFTERDLRCFSRNLESLIDQKPYR